MSDEKVAVGFRVKTGRATAVVVAGDVGSPRVLERKELRLYDPAVPESGQPYHAGLDLPKRKGEEAVRRAAAVVRKVSIPVVQTLIRDLQARGMSPVGAGLVVGSETDPGTLPNPHMRAHASEGKLFREVVEEAVGGAGVRSHVFVERGIWIEAASALRRNEGEVRKTVDGMGRAVGRPWRAEEKTAAVAAWVILGGGGMPGSAGSAGSGGPAAAREGKR